MPVTRVVHGMKFSTCTQRVLFTAAELNIDLTFAPVDILKGEHKKPQYLENMQPFGVIPVYEELNDKNESIFKIYESRAIGRYLNKIGGGALIPIEPHAFGLFEQFSQTEVETATPLVSTIVAQRIFSKLHGNQPNEEIIKSKIEPLRTALGVLNKRLTITKNYIVGDFSLVDIFYAPYLQLLAHTPEWKIVEEYPEVIAWFNRVTTRPTWKKIVEEGKLPQ